MVEASGMCTWANIKWNDLSKSEHDTLGGYLKMRVTFIYNFEFNLENTNTNTLTNFIISLYMNSFNSLFPYEIIKL